MYSSSSDAECDDSSEDVMSFIISCAEQNVSSHESKGFWMTRFKVVDSPADSANNVSALVVKTSFFNFPVIMTTK